MTLCPLLSIVLLCCSSLLYAQKPDYARLDTLLYRLDRTHKAMGTVLLYKNGEVLYQKSIGNAVADSTRTVPNSAATAYRIGSVTKVYTAAMIWQLIDEGKLKETALLSRFFPKIPNAKNITIAQLLSHHSGLYNFTEDTSEVSRMGLAQTRRQLLSRFEKQQPVFKPGERGEYSNTNYVLLAFILEEVTGASYAANLHQRITGPLRLQHTKAGVGSEAGPAGAVSYAYTGGSWQETGMEDLSGSVGAGNIVALPLEVAHFLDALFRGEVVSAGSLARMKAQQDGYGMGLFEFPFYQRKSYGHTGHIDAFSTAADYNPEDSLVTVMALNGVNTGFNDIAIGILSLYYGEAYELPDYEKKVTVDAGLLRSYEGVYSCPEVGMDITIRNTAEGLTAQATGQEAFPLTPVSDREFSFEPAGIVVQFGKPEAGVVATLTLLQGGSIVPFSRKQ